MNELEFIFQALLDDIVLSEVTLFKILWKILPKKSFISGLPLKQFENSPYFFNCFAHVLSKSRSKYPHFRLYAKNIVLLTPEEHRLFDQGTDAQRKDYSKIISSNSGKIKVDWDKLYRFADELKAEYEKEFPCNVGGIIYKYSKEEVNKKICALNKRYFDKIRKGS